MSKLARWLGFDVRQRVEEVEDRLSSLEGAVKSLVEGKGQ